MYYVYVIQSLKYTTQIYIGYTQDLKKRINHHNSGGSFHTSKFKPWKLLFYLAFTNKITALEFEKYLKSNSGRAFMNKHLISKT